MKTIQSALPALLLEALSAWQDTDQSLDDFLAGQLSPDDAAEILGMVDAIHAAHAALKQSDGSTRRWLGQLLAAANPELSSAELEPVELGSLIIDHGLAGLGPLAQILAEGAEAPIIDGELSIISRFFQSALGDPVEREVVAVASSAALKLTRQLGLTTTTAPLVAATDLGLRLTKIGLHLSHGMLDDDEAFAEVEDRIAAVVAAGAEHLVAEGAPLLGEVVGTYIGTALGNPVLGGTIGRTLMTHAAESMRPAVRSGTEALTRQLLRAARRTVSTALETFAGVLGG